MMKALLLVLSLVSIPLSATANGFPALFDVHGVAVNDSLNVRNGPGTEHNIVSQLAYSAIGIEVIQTDETGRWGLVNTGEGSGWVALRYMQRHPGQPIGAFPETLSCFGTEPFWDLKITSGTAVLNQLSVEQTVQGNLWRTQSTTGTMGFGTETLTGIMTKQACNDGMSDREYGIRVNVLLGRGPGTEMISGCCSLR